jgi:hypothetical protein
MPTLEQSGNVPWHAACTILRQGIREMTKIRAILQHNLNSLHIYCRLVHFGMDRGQARYLVAKIEKLNLYKMLYG